MAHFARLDSNNVITRVHVVDNNWVLDGDGNESEAVGIQYLQNLYNTTDTFVQCSYTGRIRGSYPKKGDTYDSENDVFRTECSYTGWTFNSTTGKWEPPTPRPADTEDTAWEWCNATEEWVDYKAIVEVPEEESTPE